MDSDRGERDLKPAVQRLRDEISRAGTGGTWIATVYTVENYVEPTVLEDAVRKVHPNGRIGRGGSSPLQRTF
jgi:hypothetical protein